MLYKVRVKVQLDVQVFDDLESSEVFFVMADNANEARSFVESESPFRITESFIEELPLCKGVLFGGVEWEK